ncbi:MAG: signal peptide peptidase SppA [Pseudomonadales bacterium]|nr:signal peptide peptidase SppA [Pseudomonadales bacterium]
MRKFFSGLWKLLTGLRNAVINLLFLAIVLIILVGIFSSQDQVSIPEHGALVLSPSGVIVDQKRFADPVATLLSGNEQGEAETLLGDILEAIALARDDVRIDILVLRLDRLQGASPAHLEEIGQALTGFRASGKSVFAFGDSFSQSQYYLAAHADKVFLNEHSYQMFGGVFMPGIGVFPMHFRTALDNLKVRLNVFKVGTYKGAIEPYIRDDMSPAVRDANIGWMNVIWDHHLETIAGLRNLTTEQVREYTNNYPALLRQAGSDGLRLAVQRGLVDDLMTHDEWIQTVADMVGATDHDYNHVDFRDYLKLSRPPVPITQPGIDKVALITAKGTIYDGDIPAGDIGGDTVAALIRQAQEDNTVKAVVLRVDSPGGSASAAEKIRSALEDAQNAGKPVVVSMGGYAASGGYWISATANKIYASPVTVTGSIGVFSVFPTLDESLDAVGISTDGVGTTPLANSFDPTMPLNPMMADLLDQGVHHTYQKFIGLVARGRNMTTAEVDEIAQGRVWAGTTALDLGLVDSFGTLNDAIESAAGLAGLTTWDVMHVNRALSPKEQLIQEIMNSAMVGSVSVFSPETRSLLEKISSQVTHLTALVSLPGVYAHCLPCEIR